MRGRDGGMVYLVGAGPGDPGLLTLRGRECIGRADAVVYDYLAGPELLDYAPRDAELIYVGKKAGSHSRTQKEINELLVDLAGRGLIVVRLKGGDPFVFGRGGEEAQELAHRGIPFEVVPGVTSAVAVPAYAGIPITHRDFTATAAFVTGHEDPSKEGSTIAWDRLSTGAGTLVFLMGVGNLPGIVERLIQHGRSAETPVAVIHRGTVADQRTITGPLGRIADMVQRQDLRPPAAIVVGEVVSLRKELSWFENRPLFGRRILVTRARAQASSLVELLTDLGAECIQFPTIEVVPPHTWEPLDRAAASIGRYSWVLFTSVNGVRFFFERMEVKGLDARALGGVKIGAIGPATAESLRMKGIIADLIPGEYRAEAVVEALGRGSIRGAEILIPRAEKAREILPMELERMGAKVEVVPAYRTVLPEADTGRIRSMLEQGRIDMVTFTSSSTVSNFAGMFPHEEQGRLKEWMRAAAVACIGPITAGTSEDKGFPVTVVPSEYTIEGLAGAICEYFSQKGPAGS